MKRFKGVKGAIVFVILIMLIIAYYFYLSNRSVNEKEKAISVTAVQSILLDNLDISYPPSPKEVIKYFCEITKCFYNEEYTEEELKSLAFKIRELYDVDLIADKSDEQYLKDLKNDIKTFNQKKITISSYSTSSSSEVEYYAIKGYEFAKLYCVFTLRQGTELKFTTEQFLLRKDDKGHWKIYGWELADTNKNE